MHVCIDVDVWCQHTDSSPVYRVYVDNDMLTERTFIWPGARNYITEHIEVDIEPGVHQVRIENCSGHGVTFIADNIRVNGQIAQLQFVI